MPIPAPSSIPRDEHLVSDRDFLLALDPRLESVHVARAAARAGDLAVARTALVNHFRTRSTPRWFFDLRDGRRGTIRSSEDRAPVGGMTKAQTARVIKRADEVCTHVVRLTGNLPYDLGPDLNWRTRELLGMTTLPSIFKRHAFLRELAAAYALTGRARYARKFNEMVSRWLKDWPLVVDEDMSLSGVVLSRADGHKTMPTAGRWLSWMDALYSGIVFAPAVPVETAFGLIKSLWFTALQYRRYAGTPHAPANHHLWSRGIMPVVFGALLPEFPQIRAMVGQGRSVIDWHARHGFLPDGGYEERSSSYALFVMRMYLLAMAMERLNGVTAMGARARAAVRRSADALAALTLPNGALPDIGDGGVGSPARLAGELAELAACAGSRTAGAVIQHLGLAHHLPAERPTGPGDESPPVSLPLTSYMPDSGYLVARDGWRRDSSAMVLSLPGKGLSSHAHDDALSLQLIVCGEPIIGTPYSELKAIVHQDRYFHGQACGQLYAMTSHNVVLVGGKPLRHPRELVGRHGVPPTPVIAHHKAGPDSVTVSARHAAYPGTRVSRQVCFEHAGRWTVVDDVTGDTRGPHVARWHFEYGVDVHREGRTVVAQRGDARLIIRYSGAGACRARLYRGQRWLGKNPLRPGTAAPWVLDVRFDGEHLQTVFTLAPAQPTR